MSQLDDILTAIDGATNMIASNLDSENAAISAVQSDVASLHAQLTTAPTVTQAVLDRLSAAASKLSTAGSTIASQTATLKTIAADPANPVPTAPPTTPTPAS